MSKQTQPLAPSEDDYGARPTALPDINPEDWDIYDGEVREPESKPNGAASELGEWDAGDDTAPIDPRGWLLGTTACRRFVGSILSEGGTGKTALRIAQGLALATGKEITGEHVFQRCRVLIVSLEDDKDELRRRVRAAMLHHGISQKDVKGWLFLATPGVEAGKLVVTNDRGLPVRSALADTLEVCILKNKIDFVILAS